MNAVTYNIPLHLFKGYAGRSVVLRTDDPREIVRQLTGQDIELVQYVQLLSVHATNEAVGNLSDWDKNIPLDIVLGDPAAEFPLLYNFSKLLDKFPIRVSIQVAPGFGKAVKLALALNFAVKLVVGQPDEALIDEMNEVLDLYLHGPNVSRPVEFFHSLFLSAYREEPANVWMIQEDDAEHFRFVSDDGVESESPRFGGADPNRIRHDPPTNGNGAESKSILECDTCEYHPACAGYFKWPDQQLSAATA